MQTESTKAPKTGEGREKRRQKKKNNSRLQNSFIQRNDITWRDHFDGVVYFLRPLFLFLSICRLSHILFGWQATEEPFFQSVDCIYCSCFHFEFGMHFIPSHLSSITLSLRRISFSQHQIRWNHQYNFRGCALTASWHFRLLSFRSSHQQIYQMWTKLLMIYPLSAQS